MEHRTNNDNESLVTYYLMLLKSMSKKAPLSSHPAVGTLYVNKMYITSAFLNVGDFQLYGCQLLEFPIKQTTAKTYKLSYTSNADLK